MDAIVAEALNEICARASEGISLKELWPCLQKSLSACGLHLCDAVKQAVWNGLLEVPSLRFEAQGSSISSNDSSIKLVEQSENLGVKIVAADYLIDSSLGLYDLECGDWELSTIQRQVLERLAAARFNGITQNELAKEFGVNGQSIFFVVKSLECQGLLVRRFAIVRTKESEAEGRNGTLVHTNLLYLSRYAKHLNVGSQQRLEITRSDTIESTKNAEESNLGDSACGETAKEDIFVKDFEPSMRAVCDKLESSGKVLVVSDIKKALGYQKTHGHRAWRNICKRLKEAGCVEEFKAEVNNKVVNCLRLLRKFEPGYECDLDHDQPMKCAKRGQITEQVVELPIDHQIYNMIEAEGQDGILVTEVCKRLGLHSKRNHRRMCNLFSRFGVQQKPESHKRGVTYRAVTRGKSLDDQKDLSTEDQVSLVPQKDLLPDGQSSPVLQLPSIPQEELRTSVSSNKLHSNDVHEELLERTSSLIPEEELRSLGSSIEHDSTHQNERHVRFAENVLNVEHEIVHKEQEVTPEMLKESSESGDGAQVESLCVLSTPSNSRKFKRYPCLRQTSTSILREQRILERLQADNFSLAVELYKWLESFEKDTPTTMDRKTLTRHLKKLQDEGHCKCILVNVPNVSNCGRYHPMEVVLHPSIQNLSSELLEQIYERIRNFEMQSRGHALDKLKNDPSLPVLEGVKRTSDRVHSDGNAAKVEAMRANGFVHSKMVRARLLHTFLWAHVSSLPDWDHFVSSGSLGDDMKNSQSSCKLFALDEALKAMPLELFLQVAGSAKKFDDLVGRCRLGLRLSDLPVQEYKCLMDTLATGRISWIINTLCRLKLIRFCEKEITAMSEMVPCAVLTHALELKPYIEEPAFVPRSSTGDHYSDLRPRVKHDFVFTSMEAVYAYWKTLEYCYCAADPAAASQAFPGSSVREVYSSRSWSSTQVMTTEQREELLNRVTHNDHDKKISFTECDKIARDLNLTMEQVVHFCRDKRKLGGTTQKSRGRDSNQVTEDCGSTCQRKKRPSDCASENAMVSDSIKETNEPMVVLSNNETSQMNPHGCFNAPLEAQTCDEVELGSDEEEGAGGSFISQCASSRLKPSRRAKFVWTHKLDRQLVMKYVTRRASLGAKFNRVDWASISDLPAPPDTCRRRMALLNSDSNVRRAVMNLCNLLGERYALHLNSLSEKGQSPRDLEIQDASILCSLSSDTVGNASNSNFQENCWNDFEVPNVKMALDEVLQCKLLAKLEPSKRVGLRQEKEWPGLAFRTETKLSSRVPDVENEQVLVPQTNHVKRQKKDSSMFISAGKSKTRCHRLSGKFLELLSNEGQSVVKRACESLAVANAVELLKVVFLSNSTAPDVPKLLLETLRQYSEDDLFAAFSFLREKKFMVSGQGSQPFVLSKRFWRCASSSPFPANTGRRAAKFATWLDKKDTDLMGEGIKLSEDLQCGDIVHLFALISLDELSISPSLPNEGVGEAEEQRGIKRKTDKIELPNNELVKKQKALCSGDGEFGSRREKGFPGIILSVSRSLLPKNQAMELFLSNGIDDGKSDSYLSIGCAPLFKHLKMGKSIGRSIDGASGHDDYMWECIVNYAQFMMSTPEYEQESISLCPELIKTVYDIICQAGHQGLKVEESFLVTILSGHKTAEMVVEVLQAFGLVVKVNAYDCVRAVDAFYRPKYFLCSSHGPYKDLKARAPAKTSEIAKGISMPVADHSDNKENGEKSNTSRSLCEEIGEKSKTSRSLCDGHRISLINLPATDGRSCKESQPSSKAIRAEDYMQENDSAPEVGRSETCISSDGCHASAPILPWMNGDGSTNTLVYKALVRRILGTVMQNPGIMEEDLLWRMDVLNPQTCRKLLELMVLDNHIVPKKMAQTTSCSPPVLLGSLVGGSHQKPQVVHRIHYFANVMTTSLL